MPHSITFSLKLLDDSSKFFPTLNPTSADRHSSDVVLHKNVFILFIVEEHLSGSAVVIGVVSMIFSGQYTSEIELCHPLLIII
jgi:hypothetical protein